LKYDPKQYSRPAMHPP